MLERVELYPYSWDCIYIRWSGTVFILMGLCMYYREWGSIYIIGTLYILMGLCMYSSERGSI